MDVRFPIGELELPNQVSLVDVKRWMVREDILTNSKRS